MAVSEEITDWQELPEVFSGLEEVLAENFISPGRRFSLQGSAGDQRNG